MGKKKHEILTDGLNQSDIKKLEKAIRQVWHWSYSKRLVIARCTDAQGFGVCEKCKKRCPKVQVDHIKAIGTFDDGYIRRSFVPSRLLQGLCKNCHKQKTAKDMVGIKKKRLTKTADFF